MKSSFKTLKNKFCQQATFADNQFFAKCNPRAFDAQIS